MSKGKIYLGDILVSKPSEGSVTITENGTHDVSEYEQAVVNVSGGGGGGSSKVLNKLNGRIIVATDFTGYDTNHPSFTHTYQFSEEPIGATFLCVGTEAICNENFPYSTYRYSSQQTSTTQIANPFITEVETKNIVVNRTMFDFLTDGKTYGYEFGGSAVASWSNSLRYIHIGWHFQDGSYEFDSFWIQYGYSPCFVRGTKITLSDGVKKNVEDITYDDNLLVWDFDNGKVASAKPLWISKAMVTNEYHKITLSDGTILNLVGSNGKCHRLLCLEDNAFTYAVDMVGKHTFRQNGMIVKVVSAETIQEEVEYYNLITDYHMNLYANGILTSCRYSNLYPIQDVRTYPAMKYVKQEREIVPFDAYEGMIDRKWYNGLRLGEQTIPIEETVDYVKFRENIAK